MGVNLAQSQVLWTLNGSSLVQAAEPRKQSRPLTLFLTCLDTVLTVSVLTARCERKPCSTQDKIRGNHEIVEPWEGVWPTKYQS